MTNTHQTNTAKTADKTKNQAPNDKKYLKKKPVEKSQNETNAPMDSFEKQARENLKHLTSARMKRFLDQAQNLRRNLKLRKRQQEERQLLKKDKC